MGTSTSFLFLSKDNFLVHLKMHISNFLLWTVLSIGRLVDKHFHLKKFIDSVNIYWTFFSVAFTFSLLRPTFHTMIHMHTHTDANFRNTIFIKNYLYCTMRSDIFHSINFFKCSSYLTIRFYDLVFKSSVECLDLVLGIQKALSTFTVAAVKHGRYSRSKQIIIICSIFYEGNQDRILIKSGDLICKEWSKKTSLKQ